MYSTKIWYVNYINIYKIKTFTKTVRIYIYIYIYIYIIYKIILNINKYITSLNYMCVCAGEAVVLLPCARDVDGPLQTNNHSGEVSQSASERHLHGKMHRHSSEWTRHWLN